jgi:outer membrane protein assembly factor BamC
MSFVRIGAIFLILVYLSGCSKGKLFGRDGFFRDRSDEYLRAEEIPPIDVPDGLDTAALTELFVIPPVGNDYVDPESEFIVPTPDALRGEERTLVKIQKLGDRRWIATNISPSEAWPYLQAFLEESGIKLARHDPVNGLMETAWLRLDGETETKDRYKIIVEQGLHTNTSEIHVAQLTVPASVPAEGQVNWPEKSSNPTREKWMMDKISVFLARQEMTSVSMLAQAIGSQKKVEVVTPFQGEPFLLLTLDYDRAWASVGGALNRQHFFLKQRDAATRTFHAEFYPVLEREEVEVPETRSKSFWRRFLGVDSWRWYNKDKKDGPEIIDNITVKLEQYGDREVRVRAYDESGNLMDKTRTMRILGLIRNQLV